MQEAFFYIKIYHCTPTDSDYIQLSWFIWEHDAEKNWEVVMND